MTKALHFLKNSRPHRLKRPSVIQKNTATGIAKHRSSRDYSLEAKYTKEDLDRPG